MAATSSITTLYTPDQHQVLTAKNYTMDREDRILVDEQILGVQTHLANSLIRGQIGSNFQLDEGSAAIVPGDLFCAAPSAAVEEPSLLASRKVTKAVTLALAAAGMVLGIAMTRAAPGAWFRGAMEGIVGPTVTGLAAGAAGPVRAGASGRPERLTGLSTGDFPVGYVDGYGNLSLGRERAVGAGGGGGGGGYSTILDEGSPLTQRTSLNFTGSAVAVTDVGGVTTVAISATPPPTGTANGQTQLWNGSAWTAGALDLADVDAVTGTLIADRGGTGISGAGGTANRVLTTADGATWAAGLVALTTMVSGQLPFANFADGSATSVFGRAGGISGVQASIAATADGQAFRRAGGALAFGALDLSNATTFTGLLPLANVAGGSAVGQVLRNTAGNVPAWGAVDLADTDAVTGLLPFANIANGSALSVFGRSANSAGVMASITGTANQVLLVNAGGTAVAFGTVATSGITNSAVTLAKIANGTASSVLGRSAATAGVYADITSSADGQVLRRGASGVIGFGAVDLADADAVTGLLPIANVADLAGLSVLGRSGITSGPMAAISGGAADQVLVVNSAGTALTFSLLAAGSIADGTLPLGKLANGAATSVIGRAGATSGAYADISATADGQFFQRAGGSLVWASLGTSSITGGSAVGQVLINAAGNVPTWGAVDLADTDAVTGLLPLANFASGSATSVLARASGTSGVMASLAATADGQFLQRAGGALSWGTFALGSLPGGSAVGQVLTNAAGNVPTWGAVDLADTDAVTGLLPFANIANGSALSVFGRSANSAGVMASITGVANQVLVVNASGTAVTFGTVANAGITNNTITLAKLANATASSVLGRSAATGGAYADITSSADGQVLRRGAAGVVGFGAVDLADTDAVTGTLPYANLPTVSGWAVYGRSVNTVGVISNIAAAAAGQALRVDDTGTTLGFGDLPTASYATNSVTYPKIQQVTALTVLGNGNAVTANVEELTATADKQFLMRSGGVVGFFAPTASSLPGGTAVGQVLRNTSGNVPAWGAVDLADTDAVTGLLPGTNVSPNFGSGSVITTGSVSIGTNPAASGALRLANNSGITWRDSANGADVRGIVIDNNNDLVLGQSTAMADIALLVPTGRNFEFRVNGTVEYAWDAATFAGSQNTLTDWASITLGTNPASTGIIRIPSASALYSRNNANTADISLLYTNASDAVFVGDTVTGASVSLQSVNGRLIVGTSVEIQNVTNGLRFHSAVASPSLYHQDDATTALATANKFSVHAQNRIGTGATVGAELELASGTGATAGNLTLKKGGTTVLQWNAATPASDFLQFGASPATTGHIRAPHNSTVLAGLSSGASNAALVRWGATATDVASFGNSSFVSELLGSKVKLTAGVTLVELTTLTTNRDILSLCYNSTLSTTEMPANTGDMVVFLGNASSVPTASPSSAGLILYGNGGAFVTRDSTGKMTLGDSNVDMTFKVQSGFNAFTWNVGGTDVMSYVGNSSGGLRFAQSRDLISVGSAPGNAAVTFAASGSNCNLGLIPDSQNPNFASAAGIIAVGNRVTLPNAAPSTGTTYLYMESGALTTQASQGGVWQIAPNSKWYRAFATDDTGATSSTTANQTIGQFDTSSLPDNIAGIAKVKVFVQDGTNALAVQEIQVGIVINGGNLAAPGTGALLAGSTSAGAATFGSSSNILTVRITPSAATARTYKVIAEFEYAQKT